MRTKCIAGNWKMNMTKAGAVSLARELVKQLNEKSCKFVIAPPFVYLDAVAAVLKGSNIMLAAQNMAAAENGAYTGEISASMLVDLGVRVVILGHSERRSLFGETDEGVNEKVKQALSHQLDVIICVGEQLDEREAGKADVVCERQLRGALDGVTAEQMEHVSIAYEPVWAIGTGKTATPEDAQAVHLFLRAVIAHKFGIAVAENTVIQYGGSMKSSNAAALLAQPDIDGGLIGGASLQADTFVPICSFC
jgi:triosephosphate isomerase (TIM)